MRSGASTKKRKRQSAVRKRASAKGRGHSAVPILQSQPSQVRWVARMGTRIPWVTSRGAWMVLTSGVGRVAILAIGEEALTPRLLLLIPSVNRHHHIMARSHLHRLSHLYQIPDMRLPQDMRLPLTHRPDLERTHTSVLPLRITVHLAAVTPSRPSCPAPGPLHPIPSLVRHHMARGLALRLPYPWLVEYLHTGPGPGPVRHRPSPPALSPTLPGSHVPVRHRLFPAHHLSPSIPGSLASPMPITSRGPRASAEAHFLDPSSHKCCCLRPMGSAALQISHNRTLSSTL
jgi:hypothetical protein